MRKKIILGISLLSFNIFAQDYVYKGINEVEATIGMNNSDGDSGQETVSADCYDPANIGKRISAQGCDGLLIVDNDSLRQMVRNDENYADTAIFTGQVTDMSYLFCNFNHSRFPKCTLKDPIYTISNWNTENVVSMQWMFRYSSYNQSLNNWNVSNVKNMYSMFANTTVFNKPLNNWNVSNVNDMNNMFFNSPYNQPLNSWSVNNVTNMSNMFRKSNYNKPLNNWNVSNVTDMNYMFQEANTFNQDISNWCVVNLLSEPLNFSLDSPLSNTNDPNWGSCP
tara:strand:+ start:6261 stop:7100 length:840 start_codon:yes stop_codon:yes gene_type:complete